MENLLLLLTASLAFYRPKRAFCATQIGHTGCTLHFSPDAVFERTVNEEGDELWFAEHEEEGLTYGVLCAGLSSELTMEEAQELTDIYLHNLRKPFMAPYNTGLTPCDAWRMAPGECSWVDYWQDKQQLDWKLRAYTNGRVLSVLYVKNIAEAEVSKVDAFLDSFRFVSA